MGGNCTYNRCVGLEEGKHCRYTSDCNVGYFCKYYYGANTLGYCTALFEEGADCSDGHNLCKLGYYCARRYSGNAKTCQKLYSLPSGSYIYEDYNAELCEYPAIKNSYCRHIASVKQSGNSLSYPYKCDLDSDKYCSYVLDDGNTFYDPECRCSFSSTGNAYCPFPSAEIMKLRYSKLRDALLASQNCHFDVYYFKKWQEWEFCTSDKTLV